MKAFVTHSLTGPDSLAIEELPAPGPLGPGQVRVAMRAASLNYRDKIFVAGAFRAATVPDLIPCSDGTGEVVEVAPDVWRVKVGDRIALTFNPEWIGGPWQPSPGALGRGGSIQGVMCEQVVINQAEAVILPAHLSYEEGATLPCAAVTAWHALCGTGVLMPGMSVLLQGSGGVSLFGLQFAKLFGARVIMTTSSPERCAKLKELGADETIDYRAVPDWNLAVRKLTGGLGVDLTVEIGGADTVARSLGSTRAGGRVSLVGLLTGMPNTEAAIFSAGAAINVVRVGSRDDFDAMNRAIAFHQLRPIIDSSYAFEQLPEALRHLESGRHIGKIVVRIA